MDWEEGRCPAERRISAQTEWIRGLMESTVSRGRVGPDNKRRGWKRLYAVSRMEGDGVKTRIVWSMMSVARERAESPRRRRRDVCSLRTAE